MIIMIIIMITTIRRGGAGSPRTDGAGAERGHRQMGAKTQETRKLSLSLSMYIYIYIHTHMYVCVYISLSTSLSLSLSYIYIYTYLYTRHARGGHLVLLMFVLIRFICLCLFYARGGHL